MYGFICPVCGNDLTTTDKSMKCINNHNFDISKSGYVNLLMNQKIKEKRHGDDRLMVLSRRDFLNKGYYNILMDKLYPIIGKHSVKGCRILDAGCGECWYTSNIYNYLTGNQIEPQMLAVDISKDALSAGARRNQDIKLAVASIFQLPVRDKSCNILFNIFAPHSSKEFSRVLKKDGILIRVIPLEKHLFTLKKIVYDEPYENTIESYELNGFMLAEKLELRDTIHINCNEDIMSLFKMTPYYYKTSVEDQKKIQALNELDTEVEFGILVYKKV